MKNIFKMAVVAIALTMTAVTANAQQKGDMAAGAKLAFGTGDGYSNLGIGAKFQYNVTDPIRLEGAFTYFLPKKAGVSGLAEVKTSMWDFSANAHYLFPVADKITVYPLAGLSILGASVKGETIMGDAKAGTSEFGLDLGGGVDFRIAEATLLNAEAKYIIAGGGLFVLSAGVAFQF
jgi:outer membrane protein X